MSRRASAIHPPESELPFVLAVCRSALASDDEVMRHQVRRLLEHFENNDMPDKASAVRELLDDSKNTKGMSPVRLHRSRAMRHGEPLTKVVRPPVDRETAVPLAEIIWPEQLPTRAPTLPADLRQAVMAIIEERHHLDALKRMDVRPTRSALIYGLPGTGKTHLALWLAGQLGMPVVVARLDGLISSFLGTTSRNIGHLFDFVDRYDCVLLLDEFDAVAKLRDDPHEVGEIKRVVNTILQRLDQRQEDGFTVGITNHEQLLDPAVWRRFEIQIHMPKPNLDARTAILHTYLKPMTLEPGQIAFLAWLCDEMSGSEIETFVKGLKRLEVLGRDPDRTFIDLCRQAAGVHVERLAENRRHTLTQTDQQVAKLLANEPSMETDPEALGHVFGKSKSTITRWLKG